MTDIKPIKVIAFDYGGVLFSDAKDIYKKLFDKYGYSITEIRNIIHSEQRKRAMRGEMPDDLYWEWAAKSLPANYDINIIRQEYYDSYVLDQDILNLIYTLDKKYQVVSLTGNLRTRADYLRKKYNIQTLFSQEFFSFDAGYTKPEKGFVEYFLKNITVSPAEIIWVDDNKESNGPVAESFRINFVVYKRGQIRELKQDLSKFNVI